MEKEWNRRNLLIENVQENAKPADIASFFNKFQKVYSVDFVTQKFNNFDFFLRQAIITFDDNVKNDVIKDGEKFEFMGNEIQVFLDLEERENFEFFIYGIRNDDEIQEITNELRKFRVSKIDFNLTKGKTFARALFGRARDRDAAMIKAKRPGTSAFYFFPSKTKLFESQILKRNQKEIKYDYQAQINGTQVMLSARLLSNIMEVPEKLELSFNGDEQILIDFLRGKSIIYDVNSCVSLMTCGRMLEINELSDLSVSDFLNFDNVVYLANKIRLESSEKVHIVNFIAPSFRRLSHNGRLRNIPAEITASIIKKTSGFTDEQILKLVYQNTIEGDNKTCLVKLIDFEKLSIADVKKIVADPRIQIDFFKNEIIELTRKKIDIQMFLTLKYDPKTPLAGVFSYIFDRDRVNFRKAVQVEASSTNSGDAYNIIEAKSREIFVTKTMASQFIKFTLIKDEVQLTNYVIQTHNDSSRPYIKNWDLSGSKDGINWVTLDSVTNNSSLSKPSSIFMRKVQTNEFYRAFKLSHTGPNSLGYDNIAIAHLELYGSIRNYEPDAQ